MKTSIERLKDKKISLEKFLPDEISRIRRTLEESPAGNFLEKIEAYEKERNTFILKNRQVPLGSESFLVILRRWNSYTPSLPIADKKNGGLNQYSVGGGYFLFLQSDESLILNTIKPGYGLIIDPGYNFIHNFGSAGFGLDDIDGILMTHAHNDHTNDFESILSLLFQRNHRHGKDRSPKKVDLFFNVGSFKKFSNYLDLARKDEERVNDYIGKVVVMSPGQTHRIPDRLDIECDILTLFTNHHELITADYTLGLCFKIGGRNVMFSGDTGWNFETSQKNEDFLKDHNIYTRENSERDNIDLLIAHIGTVTREEFELKAGQTLDGVFYDKHLGTIGVIAMVEQWKPKTCIISEFGEELTHIRTDMVREIEKTLKKLYSEINCFAGDIGLFAFLDTETALCYASGKTVPVCDLAFEETESNGIKSIKYFSVSPLSQLNPVGKLEYICNLKMVDGLNLYKKYYLIKTTEIYGINESNKPNLLAEFDSLKVGADPASFDEYQVKVKGLLFALSTLIEDPSDFIAILRENPHIGQVINILRAYSYKEETVGFLEDLVSSCYMLGFGQEDASYSEKILNEYHAKTPGLIIDAYIEKKIDKAGILLDNMKNTKLSDVWPQASEFNRIHYLFEKKNEVKGLQINENEQQALELYNQYSDLISALEKPLENIAITLWPEEDWYGRVTSNKFIAKLQESMEKAEEPAEKESIKSASEQHFALKDLNAKMIDIANKGLIILESLGASLDKSIPVKKLLFFIFYNLFKFQSANKHNDGINNLLDSIRAQFDNTSNKIN